MQEDTTAGHDAWKERAASLRDYQYTERVPYET